MENLGKVSYTHTISLKENTHPVVNASRKVPVAMKPKILAELTCMGEARCDSQYS